MPAPFKQITREQFAELLSKFPFKRKINAVHMHHTWRPDHSQYRGHDTIVAMWRFHTQQKHWSDIAQHITIAPDGSIWLGRDWNRPPASAAGHNGNEVAGPFMFEMIGDFDEGKDVFDKEQRKTALEVITRVQQRFGLPSGTLQFHNMMSTKSCPGTSVDYQTVLHDVDELHRQLMGSARATPAPDGPFPREHLAMHQVIREAIESLQRVTERSIDPPDAEPCFHGRDHADWYAGDTRDAADARGAEREIRLDAAALQALRPHIVNLRMGLFSKSGDWNTTPQDVDAIFEEHLPKALAAARAADRPLKLLFYAHGGLNSEREALARTRELVDWWKENGVYPIHFVWETGLGETLGQILERSRQGRDAAARNYFSDHISDPLVEAFVHHAGGKEIWTAMKWSAQQSSLETALGGGAKGVSAEPGGAWYVAEQLARFCKAYQGEVEVHACGHSAGAIFHSHFIPCALARGVPRFHSLHLMAPAVRVDLFQNMLQDHIGKGKGIEKMTMYTMADSFEKNDNCGIVYRKSLLYLIYKGLEPEMNEPVLGLERCIRANAGLKQLFGIGGGQPGAEVVWSDNGLRQGRSASQSRTHGGFDDDPATMGSIVRRVLGKADADRIVELPVSRGDADPWRVPADPWAEILAEHDIAPYVVPAQFAPGFDSPPPSSDGFAAQTPQSSPVMMAESGAGRRIALCVGIDTYPSAPLGGCVNDARAWSDMLVHLGFEAPRTLFNQQATRSAILQQLTVLLDESRAGDVIVFQYAGHGTQVPDLDGDELGGDTPDDDEALCPYDFATGELLIDDDIRAIYRRLPSGVNLSCFFDCCHSGTIARMGFGKRPSRSVSGRHVRFIPADENLIANYVAKRAPMLSRGTASDDQQTMREVVFSACRSHEKALESSGHGDFTRHAMKVLSRGIAGLSNSEFAERVIQEFGPAPEQHPELQSSGTNRSLGLLQPLQSPARGASRRTGLSAYERGELASRLMRRAAQDRPLPA